MKTGRFLLNSGKLLAKILEKWPVKVLSLAAAIVIAVFYRMNTLETRSFSVPLKIETNDSFITTGSYVNSVRINLRGEAGSINSIHEEDIEAYIDLNKYANEGLYRIPVQVRKKGNALGIQPLEISVLPIEISLILERKVSRSVPVNPVFSGTTAQGYELTSQTIIPDSVTAQGPQNILDNLRDFPTETIDLEGRNVNFSTIVGIINDNPFITIQGNRMIEYRGTIRPIERELQNTETGDIE
jgi:hypothetical protein